MTLQAEDKATYDRNEPLIAEAAAHALLKSDENLRSAIRMTPPEQEVMAMIVEGLSNRQIAERMDVVPHRVKSHVCNILDKLALHNWLGDMKSGREG